MKPKAFGGEVYILVMLTLYSKYFKIFDERKHGRVSHLVKYKTSKEADRLKIISDNIKRENKDDLECSHHKKEVAIM